MYSELFDYHNLEIVQTVEIKSRYQSVELSVAEILGKLLLLIPTFRHGISSLFLSSDR